MTLDPLRYKIVLDMVRNILWTIPSPTISNVRNAGDLGQGSLLETKDKTQVLIKSFQGMKKLTLYLQMDSCGVGGQL